jgi:hypothetical protein
MSAEFYRHDGTAWRKCKESYRHDGTAWRKCKERWRYDGTAWRKVFSGFTAQAFTAFYCFAQSALGTGAKIANCTFSSDGTYTAAGTPLEVVGADASGNWATPTTTGGGASWSIKVTVTSGSFTSSSTTGSWVSMATNWIGSKNASIGAGFVVFDVAFSPDGGTTTAVTVTGCRLEFNSSPA